MKRFVAATIVAKNCLSLARVLARSFQQYHPDIPFVVLLADQMDGLINANDEPFTLLDLNELAIDQLQAMCFWYEQQELSYALTPYLIGYLLNQGYDNVLFLKQESMVLNNLSAILEVLPQHSIMLTPHLLAPVTTGAVVERELNILLSGVYNTGFIGVHNCAEAQRFVQWWQERLFQNCQHNIATGKHYEQRWLDLVPGYFDGVHILDQVGLNIGHWNLPERALVWHSNGFTVEGQTAYFMRFSGFDPRVPDMLTRFNARMSLHTADVAVAIAFHTYHALLLEAGYQQTTQWPYHYDTFANGVPIARLLRVIFVSHTDWRIWVDPFSVHEGSYYAWLGEPSMHAAGQISNLWDIVYQIRPDLQLAFPEYCGVDREPFLLWAATQGMREYQLAATFAPVIANLYEGQPA